jgi:Ca2+-binding EF-hand superfamily protein
LEDQAAQILNIVNSSNHSGEIDFAAFLEIFGFNDNGNSEQSLQQLFEAFDSTGQGAFGPE